MNLHIITGVPDKVTIIVAAFAIVAFLAFFFYEMSIAPMVDFEGEIIEDKEHDDRVFSTRRSSDRWKVSDKTMNLLFKVTLFLLAGIIIIGLIALA